jgi:hypothetical protein
MTPDRALEKLVVIRISADDSQAPPHANAFHEREQFFLDQEPDLLIAELELGVRQSPQILIQDRSGNQHRNAAGLPKRAETRGGSRKKERGDHRIGVEDDPDHFCRLRAQRIAASTSFSARPRPRIFGCGERLQLARFGGNLVQQGRLRSGSHVASQSGSRARRARTATGATVASPVRGPRRRRRGGAGCYRSRHEAAGSGPAAPVPRASV